MERGTGNQTGSAVMDAAASLLGVVEEPLAVLDREGRLRDCNRALLEWLGGNRDRLCAGSYTELVDDSDRTAVTKALRRLPAGGFVDRLPVTLRANGGQHPAVLSIRPFRDDDGRVTGAFVAHQKPRSATPEPPAGERTRLEQELAGCGRELEAVRQELQTFVHSVSHDLRRPLRVVNGFVEALEEDYGRELPEEAHDFLGRIRQGTECMADLLDALLALSRVSGRELHREPLDLAELARAVAEEVSQAESDRRVEWRVDGPLPEDGDPGLLRVLLHNLLENAWKYAGGDSGARVEVGSKRLNGRTVYYVRDNGPGFEVNEAEQLFAPFQRFHCQAGEGTGIGLAIVQRIVHRHGGQVWAEGAPGRGATFYFTLESGNPSGPTQLPLLE